MLGADTQKDSETRQGAETMDIAYATCGREQPVHEPGKNKKMTGDDGDDEGRVQSAEQCRAVQRPMDGRLMTSRTLLQCKPKALSLDGTGS